MDILVTNNPLAEAKYKDVLLVENAGPSLSEVLIRVRDLVHGGHTVLTHPLTGGIKPNDTPYKSVLVSGARGKLDEQSLRIIEESVLIAQRSQSKPIPEHHLPDLQAIDLSLIRSAIDKHPMTTDN